MRAIDGLLTIGRGQRVGIFSGSGVGKSTLLGMIARNTSADVNVIALLGERGREVRDFIENSLGPEGLARSVVIVATGDEAALIRARGAQFATAIAEYYRDQGKHVLLMVDSITRVAMAWREIGLAVGEPPTTKGYPPSVFAALPRLLERAGNAADGAISGIYTVLVEGDDFNEPVADAARSILDGHIVLTRKLAMASHFPAIDALESSSRVRDHVADAEHRRAADLVMRMHGGLPRKGRPDRRGRLPAGHGRTAGHRTARAARAGIVPGAVADRAHGFRRYEKGRAGAGGENRGGWCIVSGFRFRLQKVLEVREQREKESATRLAEAHNEAVLAEQKRLAIEAARNRGVEGTSRGSGTPAPAGTLQQMALFIAQLDEHLAVAEKAQEEAGARVDTARNEFRHALTQRQVMDRLRERYLTLWREGEERLDRTTMDAVALARFTRRQQEDDVS